MDLSNVKKIYFIGIGGIAMSAAAGFARQAGYEVTGSDAGDIYDPARQVLSDLDINYFPGYSAENIRKNPADLYIVSAGEGPQNPEVKHLIDHNLPCFSFSELLYELNRDKIRIVVAGTHGKSTTAGLLGYVLESIDDSSFVVGGVVKNDAKNFHQGDGHYVVFEGDEYKALFDDATPKFHFYRADITVLTNLEYDHPDVFGSFEELKNEFKHLIANMPEDAFLAYNADDHSLEDVVYGTNIASVSFALENDADFKAIDVRVEEKGSSFTVVRKKDGAKESYRISLPGLMNVYNALGVIACLRTLGFSYEQLSSLIETYQGISRRFELIGEPKGVAIVNDYAHHPTAVSATLAAARDHFGGRKIWAVFEPHTYSRTAATLDQLAASFSAADRVLVSQIYAARENQKDSPISSQDVIAAISRNHHDARLVSGRDEALQILIREVSAGDVVVVMSVGDFNLLAPQLAAKLEHGN